MNGRALFRFLIMWTLAGGLCPGQETRLVLQDGTLLTGESFRVEEERLLMEAYWARNPVPVPVSQLSRMEPVSFSPEPTRGVEVELICGSRIWLQDPVMEDQHLTGLSSWGEPVRFHVDQMRHLFLFPVNLALNLLDTSSADDTPVSSLVRRGHMAQLMRETAGSVVQVEEWPEKFLLDLEVKLPGGEERYQLLCSGPDPARDGRFLIRVSRHRATLTLIEPDEQNRLRSTNLAYPLQAGQSVRRIRILGDTLSGTMRVQIGNGQVMDWRLESGAVFDAVPGQPSTLMVQENVSGEEAEIVRLQLIPWPSETFPPLEWSSPGILLRDGTVRVGNVQSLTAETVVFLEEESATGPLTFPRGDLLEWVPTLKGGNDVFTPQAELATRRRGERLYFRDLSFAPGPSGEPFRIQGTLGCGALLAIPADGYRQLDMRPAFPPSTTALSGKPAPLVELLNGNLLYGDFKGLTGSDVRVQARWDAGDPLILRGAAVGRIQFPAPRLSPTAPYVIGLRNGCTLAGDLISLDAQQLILETDWAERLIVDRERVQSIRRSEHMSPGTPYLSDVEGWSFYDGMFLRLADADGAVQQTASGWKLLREGVYLRGTDPLAADRVRLEMELEGLASRNTGMVTVEFNGFSNARGRARQLKLRLSAHQIRGEILDGGQVQMRWSEFLTLPEREPLRVEVNVSDELDLLKIEFPGVAVWELPLDAWSFSPDRMPYEVRLSVSQGAEGVTLRELRIREGPEQADPDVKPEDVLPGKLVFRNGDRMEAHLKEVERGDAILELPGGSRLKMPLERIYHLALQEADPLFLRRKASHVRITLGDGSSEFLAEVLGAAPDQLILQREGIQGIHTLPVGYISRVEMNPYFSE